MLMWTRSLLMLMTEPRMFSGTTAGGGMEDDFGRAGVGAGGGSAGVTGVGAGKDVLGRTAGGAVNGGCGGKPGRGNGAGADWAGGYGTIGGLAVGPLAPGSTTTSVSCLNSANSRGFGNLPS